MKGFIQGSSWLYLHPGKIPLASVQDGLKERLRPHGKTVEIVQVKDNSGLNLSGDSGEWRKSRQIQDVF